MRALAFAMVFALAALPLSVEAQTTNASRLVAYCTGDPAALAEQNLARTVAVEQADAARRGALRAIADADDLRARFERGEKLEQPYLGASRFQKLGLEAVDADLAELFRRAAKDQFARAHFTAATTRSLWAANLSDGARAFAFSVVASKDICGTDAANAAWLDERLARNGWFKISLFGQDANSAAFLIAQHADADTPFQRRVLAILEPLARLNETRPQDYALLFDRVAVNEGRPQRYGSQGRCTGPGTWTEMTVEDPAKVDKRRAEMGLQPISEYRQLFAARCP